MAEQKQHFHIKSPLLFSQPLSKLYGRKVYLKLDNLQPSGSFKIRGIGAACQKAVADGATRLVGSSGGNAGTAMAFAAQELGVTLDLFMPVTAPKIVQDKARDCSTTNLHVTGKNWDAANAAALELLKTDPAAKMIHPFEGETLWRGHATLIDEIKGQYEDMEGEGRKPAAVVTCVGGGGLAAGLILGLQSAYWRDVPLVTMETEGANNLYRSLKEDRLVTLDEIGTIAKSLGALTVTRKLFDLARKEHEVVTRVVTDQQALQACLNFSVDHRFLVEPACGAVLAFVYERFTIAEQADLEDRDGDPLVLVVCGGNMASFELFEMWKKELGMA